MTRIADNVIERIKSELSLLRLVESQGYQPKKQGKDYAVSCPFHKGDDTPSLIISPKSNLFNCFGCGAAGSVIDWVMKTRGVSFRHAVEILQQDNPSLAASISSDKPAKLSRKQQLDVLLSTDAETQTLLNQVIDYYHETLLQSPEALAYLESRGLGDRELIERFKLGHANRTLGYRLPRKKQKPVISCAVSWKRWGFTARVATSILTVRWWCRFSAVIVMWWKSMDGSY